MARGTVHRRNGFEFYCEQFWEFVTWYFRPEGAEVWVVYSDPLQIRTTRKEGDALLADPERAKAEYQRRVERMANVEAAEQHLAELERQRARTQDPSWDPGGRTNNPGKVARALKRASELPSRIEAAKRAIEEAKRIRAILAAGNRRNS